MFSHLLLSIVRRGWVFIECCTHCKTALGCIFQYVVVSLKSNYVWWLNSIYNVIDDLHMNWRVRSAIILNVYRKSVSGNNYVFHTHTHTHTHTISERMVHDWPYIILMIPSLVVWQFTPNLRSVWMTCADICFWLLGNTNLIAYILEAIFHVGWQVLLLCAWKWQLEYADEVIISPLMLFACRHVDCCRCLPVACVFFQRDQLDLKARKKCDVIRQPHHLSRHS